jgi:hypothetical protein
MRSPFWSNELTKVRAASRTAAQREPIELRLAGARDGHRVEPRQPHEGRRQLSRGGHRNDVDAGRGDRRLGEEISGRDRIRAGGAQIAGREVLLEDPLRLAARIAAVQHPRRAERGAVDRLAQLRLHDVGAAGVDGEAGEHQQQREDAAHVDQRESLLPVCLESMCDHWSSPFEPPPPRARARQKYAIEYRVCGTETPNRCSGVISVCRV